MKSCRKISIAILLTFAFVTLSSQAYARQELGIHFPDSQEAQFVNKLEQAFGNLVIVSNYKDEGAMIKMLTRFNQLDAVLINKETYRRHNSATLIPLSEARISGETSVELVLATHSLLTKEEQEKLIQGYQNLLLSENGLELLEVYANGKWSVPQQNEVALEQKPSAPKQQVIALPKASPSPQKQKNIPAKPQKEILATDLIVAKQNMTVETPPTPPVPQSSASDKPAPRKEKKKGISENLWRPHVDVTGKLGNDKSLGELELFIPVAQNRDRLFFLDMRFQLDDNDETEGNFGFGLRKIIDSTWILGGYAFYDRRESFYDNDFQQVTLGVEALTEVYDARVNAYLAEDKEYLIARQESVDRVVFSGFNLVHQSGGDAFEIREKPMSGFDAELGWRLPWFDTPEIRGYVGGYHFTASGLEDISGPRGRVEVRVPDIFGWTGSLFELGGEVRHDDVRDTDYFISARGRIPFGRVTKPVQQPKGLSARMTERIQRDPDIVVAKQTTDTTTPFKETVLSSNGDDILITHVDSQSTDGNGKAEAPFNSLASAEALNDSQINDIILLYADSTFDGEGITLKPNQRLLGGNLTHMIHTDQLGEIPIPQFSTGTNMPIIRNFAGNAVTLASGSEVSGVQFSDVNTAITGFSVGGININRNKIYNTQEAIIIDDITSPNLDSVTTIENNLISNSAFDGISFSSTAVDTVRIKVLNNEIRDIDGVGIIAENYSNDMRLIIEGNTVSDTTSLGIWGLNSEGVMSTDAKANIVYNVGFEEDGVLFSNQGDIYNLYLQNNRVTGYDSVDYADYAIDNFLGTTFKLGASSGFPSTAIDHDNDVIKNEPNFQADGSSAPAVIATGTFTIVDKDDLLPLFDF